MHVRVLHSCLSQYKHLSGLSLQFSLSMHRKKNKNYNNTTQVMYMIRHLPDAISAQTLPPFITLRHLPFKLPRGENLSRRMQLLVVYIFYVRCPRISEKYHVVLIYYKFSYFYLTIFISTYCMFDSKCPRTREGII
jgi:hypothetical protein